ncbi:hypothetical protein [uncultured Microbacterium sp.]|uniref:hypothetical protein n=1 Tax=uncultured Microbacterium sp. TaxID=191216 RepID=UPI0035CA1007
MLSVRRATIDDTRSIADIRIRSWRVAYAGLIEQHVLDAKRDAAPGRPAHSLRERRRVRDLTAG